MPPTEAETDAAAPTFCWSRSPTRCEVICGACKEYARQALQAAEAVRMKQDKPVEPKQAEMFPAAEGRSL